MEALSSTDSADGVPALVLDDVGTSPVVGVRRILIVDDTPANLIAFEAALESINRPLAFAASGPEALSRLLEEDFALVLLDVQMPGMDGFETARWIRSREKSRHVPIIFVTAHDQDNATVLHAYALGAVDFLFKPVVPEVLRAKASFFGELFDRSEELVAIKLERVYQERERELQVKMLQRERQHEQRERDWLARHAAALEDADRAKDRFLTILGSELRNPLTPIRMCVDSLKGRSEPLLSPKQLAILDRQTELLSRLLEDLVDLTKVRHGHLELRLEVLDARELVQHAVDAARTVFDHKAQELVVRITNGPLWIRADRARVMQVLGHLLDNASRYSSTGGTVVVECGGERCLSISIADDGIGLPPDTVAAIDGARSSTGSDPSGGLGVGLTLSKQLVHAQGGELRASSDGMGRGATFTLELPFIRPQVTETTSPDPKARRRAVFAVVVDDDDSVRDLLSSALRDRGCNVRSASDGIEALSLIKREHPDIAFVDLGLPLLDGLELARSIRDDPNLSTQLVALSGFGSDADRASARDAGFAHHLVKPAKLEDIWSCVKELYDGDGE